MLFNKILEQDLFNLYSIKIFEAVGNVTPSQDEIDRVEILLKFGFERYAVRILNAIKSALP